MKSLQILNEDSWIRLNCFIKTTEYKINFLDKPVKRYFYETVENARIDYNLINHIKMYNLVLHIQYPFPISPYTEPLDFHANKTGL